MEDWTPPTLHNDNKRLFLSGIFGGMAEKVELVDMLYDTGGTSDRSIR